MENYQGVVKKKQRPKLLLADALTEHFGAQARTSSTFSGAHNDMPTKGVPLLSLDWGSNLHRFDNWRKS